MKCKQLGVCGTVVCLLAIACSDERPANVAGQYAVTLTNDSNGCAIAGFNDGGSSTVQMVIEQADDDLTASVPGIGGLGLRGLLGSSDFIGHVDEDAVYLEILGDRAFSEGNCAYTLFAQVNATARGDLIEGYLHYTRVDNDNPDCARLSRCVTTQRFNGSRSPQ